MTNINILSVFIGAITAPALGKWVNLPADEGEIADAIAYAQKLGECEEVICSDYEGIISAICSEYSNPYDLNDYADECATLSESELETLEIMISDAGLTLSRALEVLYNGDYRVYPDCNNMADVAYQIVEECGLLDGAPEIAQQYFDYEAYGRDLEIEGNFYSIPDGYLEIIR